ncbi:MAG TPA: histidine kinase [Chitinophaga sp.]|uniref:sensor histidine kinase n=1 Tax=Chitinophaga sp. TaxID=1869181 RepID=UPI002BD67AE2|nr:histidine kinase [Chitinophaga sp.]HVI47578.1 histidine kinase [Chitinophaga sp.]
MMLNYKQILKYRPFIISLHILAWACFLFFPFFIYRIQILHLNFFLKELVDNLFLIGIFYLNIYVLIPRYFNGRKIVVYFSCVILLLVSITLQQVAVDYYFLNRFFPASRGMAIRMEEFKQTKNMGGVTSDSFGPFHHRPRFYFSQAMPLPTVPALPLSEAGLARKTNVAFGTARADGGAMAFTRLIRPSFWEYLMFPEVLRRSGFFALLMLFMSGFIKIAQEWFKSEKQREDLKVEKLNAELKFLKSQINPHFLFNCLNTIYSLAHKQSVQTEHAILKLSTIMRYMIYESNEDTVQLLQELKYLQDYIDIQRLRLPKDIVVDYRQTGNPAGIQIEPMLLVPFVENAFKHGISYTEDSFIDIEITIAENMIRLIVRNSLFKERVSERGGIGLQNVFKRLEMLYTDRHEVDIREDDNQFIVDLKIVLKK